MKQMSIAIAAMLLSVTQASFKLSDFGFPDPLEVTFTKGKAFVPKPEHKLLGKSEL